MEKYYCPNCNIELLKVPLKKIKCKICGNYIYIKRRPGETEKKLVSEIESLNIDAAWDIYNINKAKEDFIRRMGIDETEYLERYKVLKGKYGRSPDLNDIEWMILNENVLVVKDYQELRIIYDRMAYIIFEEGKNPYELLKNARLSELYYLKTLEINNVQISCFEDRCNFYKEINKKVYNIDEAIKSMPIPKKECTSEEFGNCHASWTCYYEN